MSDIESILQQLSEQNTSLAALIKYLIVLGAKRPEQWPAGEVLYRQGDKVEAIYFLLSGQVYEWHLTEDRAGRPKPLGRARTNEKFAPRWLGIYDLIYRRPHTTSARLESEGILFAIGPEELFRGLYERPRLIRAFLPVDTLNRLRTVPFLANFNLTILGFLAEACAPGVPYEAGQVVYQAGDSVKNIYIIDQGQVRIHFQDDDSEVWLGNSAPFGYIGTSAEYLDTNSAYTLDHTATIGCTTTLYYWDRTDFISITGVSPERLGLEVRSEMGATLDSLSLFRRYTTTELRQLTGYLGHYHIPRHQILMHQGEFADSFWVLMPQRYATLYANEQTGLQTSRTTGVTFFNEKCLLTNTPCNSTVQAEPKSQWLRLNVEDFRAFAQADRSRAERLNIIDLSSRERPQIPPHLQFDLQPGEVLILFQRRHWIVFIRKILPGLLFFAITVGSWGFVSLTLGTTLLTDAVTLLCLLLAGAQMLWGWFDYRNDFLLLTNLRVAQQEKVALISESRYTALLEQIRDVTIEQKTVWGNFWQYGTLYIQTSAHHAEIIFDYLPDPERVQKLIAAEQIKRRTHYEATGKREMFSALERQLGLNLNIPSRVWQAPAAPARPKRNGSLWRLLFAREGRQQLMEEIDEDHIVWRKHWLFLLRKMAFPGLLALISSVAMILSIGYYLLYGWLGWGALSVPLGLLGMFCWTWLWWAVQDWNNDAYEVTESEIIDTEMRPLLFPIYFDKLVRQANLGDITNVSYTVPGPLNYLFNYGNVLVETAAADSRFSFDRVPNPSGVSDEIRRRVEQYVTRQKEAISKQRARELPAWFEMYERLGTEREVI